MKRKVWIKRKDKVKQRYWVGKTIKRNYGSKMFRDQIKKEVFSGPEEYITNLSRLKQIEKTDPKIKGSKFVEDPRFGFKILLRTIEKHPDLLKDLRGKDIFFYEPKDKKTPLGFAKGRKGIVGINKNVIDIQYVYTATDPSTKSTRDFPLSDILKHEVAHLKQQKIDPYIKHNLAEIAADYAIHTNIRKEKPRKQLMDRSISGYFSNEAQA